MMWDEGMGEPTPVKLSGLLAPCFMPVYRAAKAGGYDEIWLSGGRGSGKSSFVSLFIVMGILRDAEANAIVYRKVAETLRDSVYSQMIWAIEALGVSSLWRYGLSPMELRYEPTGQRILFRGTDKPEKSKGVKLRKGIFTFLWFEELAEFGGMEEIRTVKASVLRGTAAPGKKATARPTTFYTYNPPMRATSWVNGERLSPRKGRLCHHSDYRDMPPEWLGQGFLQEAAFLKGSNKRAYEHMYLGEVTGTGGLVFENLTLRPILPEEWQDLRLYCGHDFGFATDPDACVKCAYHARRRTLYIVGEFVRNGLSLSALAEEMKGLCADTVVTADSADPRGIAELRAQGVQLVPARKGPGSVDHGMKWLQTLAAIVIDPKVCPYAAGEFQRYEYEQAPGGGFLPRYPDGGNHTIDAVRYAMESVSARRVAVAVK